jgi:uncharacterized membrane protein
MTQEEGMAGEQVAAADERRGNPDRVRAFTDGVFAIIITILVLEIGVPADLPEESLRAALEEVGPSLIAFVISFLITGMYWVWHRDMFTQVRHVNRDVVWLNLLFLLPASLIPFASAILGEYHDDPVALHVYGAVLIAVSVMRIVLYRHITRRPRLLWVPKAQRERRVGTALAAAPIAVYVVAMAVADTSPEASLVLFLAMPLLYFILVTVLRQRPGSRDEAEEFG